MVDLKDCKLENFIELVNGLAKEYYVTIYDS